MNDVDDTKLQSLYHQIHTCSRCHTIPNGNIRFDPDKVQKKAFERLLKSELLIIGQSLAQCQVRLTGVPFHFQNPSSVHKPEDAMSQGGKFLEPHLNEMGYTLSPCKSGYKLAYASDIVQCYPGRKPNGNGDNIPKKEEIENCSAWLDEELRLVEPKIVVLLGKIAAKYFFNKYLNWDIPQKQDVWGQKYQYASGGKQITVFALPHPAYKRRKPEWVSQIYKNVAEQIREILAEKR